MSAIFAHLALNAAISAACFLLLWLAGAPAQGCELHRPWWGLGIGVIALASYHETAAHGAHNKLLLGLTEVWAIRLGLYLIWRWRRTAPTRATRGSWRG